MIYCIVCTQGHMNFYDIKKECATEKWAPILVMRTPDTVIPLFHSPQVAQSFVKRNLPKNWLCGILNITMEDAHWIDAKGWKSIVLDFPRKLKDVVEFDIEILEYESDREVEVKC